MAFYVGQKVVCVNAGPVVADGIVLSHRNSLIDGRVYTIRETHIGAGGFRYVRVTEIPKGNYLAFRFRPVVERKTDISIFQAMLNPSHQREDA